ncbi:MAG: DUF4135 domain-containing protein [Pseudorhodobacter sp.]|nr:DUF4135 domain-containing protein [Frankiaceae bacterium]
MGKLLPPTLVEGSDGLLRPGPATPADRDHLSRSSWWNSWVQQVDELGEACSRLAEANADILGPGVVHLDNSGLLGPDASDAYLACARGDTRTARRLLRVLVDHLGVVLAHYRDDLFDGDGPLTSFWATPGETHHGRWRVMGVTTSAGASYVHKVRPVDGERIFLSPEGVFASVVRAARAEDRVRLPTLDVRCGRGADGAPYSWAPWLSEPRDTALDPVSGLTALIVTAGSAPDFWRDAGCLSAAVAAFGITDLTEDNMVTADLDGRPTLVPVDLEIFLRPTVGLASSKLVGSGHQHTGIEQVARPCTGGGPLVVLSGARAVRRSTPCARSSSRSLVLDGAGGAGYGGELTAYLRGIVSTWLTICRGRTALAQVLDTACRGERVRVLRRPTADYTDALVARLLGISGVALPELDERERTQLDAGDVPYSTVPAAAGSWAGRMTVSAIGPVLRDAVEAVRGTVATSVVTDARHGVSVHLGGGAGGRHGCVSAQVEELGGLVVFRWDENTIRLGLPSSSPTAPTMPTVRARLERLDRADTELRWAWARSGFTDATIEVRLRRLVDAGARWLDAALSRYGWLGIHAVGWDASAAAARLAQHLDGHAEVQERALALMGPAAVGGDAQWSEFAGLTDACRLRRGLDQIYGTKFDWVDGRMEAVQLHDVGSADEARARLGLGTVAEAAGRASALASRLAARDSSPEETPT